MHELLYQATSAESRRASAWQDLPLFGRDVILISNATYGGWLSAFEANGWGATEELAAARNQVRQGLREPQETFTYDLSKTATADGPKFSASNPRIWKGPLEHVESVGH